MKLDVRAVTEGNPLAFRFEMDLSELRFAEQEIYRAPIRIHGQVSKTAGVLRLDARVQTELSLCCDRCMLAFTRDADERLSVTLADEAPQEEREDIFVCEGGFCDIEELARPFLVLLPPQKILCRPDCAGLCSRCGQNLNEAPCGCVHKETDPRLEALKAFLDE